MDDNRITAVIVDTCVFRDANSDFIGINKQLLPSFFSTAKDKCITLLTHPIIDNEVYKHIEASGLYKNYIQLTEQLKKCNSTLEYLKLNDEELLSKILEVDMKDILYSAYLNHYKNAVRLEYGNPEAVFELYFNGKPPFAVTGKKKHEFPDAFVIDATKNYIDQHPNDILLVVSKDPDWINSFQENENVILCETIENALTKISSIDSILSHEMLEQIFKGVYKEILTEAQFHIECECFELEDYETFEDLEIENIIIESANDLFAPLKITRDNILISTEVIAKVSGHAEVFDEENSFWDCVDKEYVYVSYADVDFVDAEVEVECEILISFDFDDPEGSAQIESFKLLNQGNICIKCEEATIAQIDEEEMALRCLREDKGYPRRK